MTDKQQSEALRLAALLDADEWPGSMTLVSYAKECVAELLRQSAEIETLRMGYAAARLEIESLNAQLHAASHGQAYPTIEDLCARIKAADDSAADREYMLDSDDCIAVLRGQWKGPMAMDKPERASHGQAPAQAAPAAVAGPSEFPHEKMDAVALGRYKVVSSDQSMFYRFAVVAGDGTQQLYIGREVDCQNMARKFAGAFLDGAFYQSQIAAAPTPAAQAADSVPVLPDFDTVEQHIYGACRRYITQDMLEPIHNLIRDAIDADRAARASAESVLEDVLDAGRWRRLVNASELSFPVATIADDPENGAVMLYGRKALEDFVDRMDEIPNTYDAARAAQEDKSHDN